MKKSISLKEKNNSGVGNCLKSCCLSSSWVVFREVVPCLLLYTTVSGWTQHREDENPKACLLQPCWWWHCLVPTRQLGSCSETALSPCCFPGCRKETRGIFPLQYVILKTCLQIRNKTQYYLSVSTGTPGCSVADDSGVECLSPYIAQHNLELLFFNLLFCEK